MTWVIDEQKKSDSFQFWIFILISCVFFFLYWNLDFFVQFLRDLDDEINAIALEEESLKRKMNGKPKEY